MNEVDIIRLVPSSDLQWWVFWVNFPEPIGRHPAVVISNDKYNDGSSVVVARIGSKPPRGKNYETLWIPIIIEDGGVLSYIKLDSISRVDKTILDRKIGLVPISYRQDIIDRYLSMITGYQPRRMVDVDVQTCTTQNKPTHHCEEPNAKKSDDEQGLYEINGLVNMLTDVNLDVRKQSSIVLGRGYLRAGYIDTNDLPLYFVAMVREYGYDGIRKNRTIKSRFDNIITEMVTRGLITNGTADKVKVKLSNDFQLPANYRGAR